VKVQTNQLDTNMEHLNYCRQAIKQWRAYCAQPNAQERNLLMQLATLAEMAKKFMLPDGGRLIEDFSLKALDENIPLNLPYDLIACEYAFGKSMAYKPGSNGHSYDRYILFAHDADETITFWSIARNCANGNWISSEMTSLLKTNYLLREGKEVSIKFQNNQKIDEQAAYDASTLLHLLNALQCSNVHIERSQAKNANKKIKAALPFDSYHILTIDVGKSGESIALANGGSHRSPREHLRRGHIVRPGEGRKPFWRNATVVCAGRSFNKVEKDYRIKKQ
jgi:antitoxin component of MazEF toxin-antitoxin module